MNILTFDIEEWYLEKVLHDGRDFKYKQFDETFYKVLDELDKRDIKATFFCVGQLAVEFPQVIREIVMRGHEVGCHSNKHTWLNKMTEKQLQDDTSDAIHALADVAGQKVVSYRAPAFSITKDNKWAINVLAECGIENDASIFPTNRDFGGYKGFPQDTPCIISHDSAILKEFPICLTSIFGKELAYSGGGYFRLLPYRYISKTIKKRDYNICYFHLADFISGQKRMMSREQYEEYFKEAGTLKNRVIRYVKSNIGIDDAYGKLLKLLSDNAYTNIRDCGFDWSKAKTISL